MAWWKPSTWVKKDTAKVTSKKVGKKSRSRNDYRIIRWNNFWR